MMSLKRQQRAVGAVAIGNQHGGDGRDGFALTVGTAERDLIRPQISEQRRVHVAADPDDLTGRIRREIRRLRIEVVG